jgi:hypothetical protein
MCSPGHKLRVSTIHRVIRVLLSTAVEEVEDGSELRLSGREEEADADGEIDREAVEDISWLLGNERLHQRSVNEWTEPASVL